MKQNSGRVSGNKKLGRSGVQSPLASSTANTAQPSSTTSIAANKEGEMRRRVYHGADSKVKAVVAAKENPKETDAA